MEPIGLLEQKGAETLGPGRKSAGATAQVYK